MNRSIRDWNDASRFLKADQFGAALQACIPSAEDWTADDRDAFETSMRQLGQEIEALTAAFDRNAELLKEAIEAYSFAAFPCVFLPAMLVFALTSRSTRSVAVRRAGVVVGVVGTLASLGFLVPSAIRNPLNWVLVALAVGGIVFVLNSELRRRR